MAPSLKARRTTAFLAIIAAGFALRFINIDRWPLWSDEGLTLLVSQWSILHLFLAPIDPTPGLYYALHKLLLGPMVDAATARAISLVCGTLTIAAAYWLAREARVPALLGAALVALSFPLIDYSQEARAYSLLVLLVTSSAAFFIRWTRSLQLAQLLLALLLGNLAFYTHLVSIFWVGPMLLAVAWIARRQAVQPILLFILLAIPEIARLLAHNPNNFSWLSQATPAEAGNTLSQALLPFRATGAWAAAIFAIIGWRIWVHRHRLEQWAGESRGAAFALAVLIFAPMLVWLFGFIKPLFMIRTILFAVPGYMLGLALLLRFEHRLARFGAVALYAGSLLATGTTRPKEEWRAIADRVGGDMVVMCQEAQAPAMRHALRRDNRVLLQSDRGLIEAWGSPWPRAYFEILSRKNHLAEAKRRGAAVDLGSYPVWPIRSGHIEQMVARPATLGQAAAYCDSVRIRDREPRYIAE